MFKGLDTVVDGNSAETPNVRWERSDQGIMEASEWLAFRDAVSDLVLITSADATVLESSASWEQVLGWTARDLRSRPLLEFIHPEDLPQTIALMERVQRGELELDLASFENRYRHADGSWRTLSWNACFRDGRWIAVARDVTQYKSVADYELLAARQRSALVPDASLSEAASELLEMTGSALGLRFGAWWEVDRSLGELRCRAVWHDSEFEEGFDLAKETWPATFRSGEGVPGRVWRDARPAWIEDVRADRDFVRQAVARQLQLQDMYCVPVLVEGDVVGAFEYFPGRGPYDPDLAEFLEETADALAAHAARSFAEGRERSALAYELQASALSSLSVARLACTSGDAHQTLSCIDRAIGELTAIVERLASSSNSPSTFGTAPDPQPRPLRVVGAEPGARDEAFRRSTTDAPGRIALTDREHEVLDLIVAGLSYRAIADRLGISTQTVKVHSANLRQKFSATSRSGVVAAALRMGVAR